MGELGLVKIVKEMILVQRNPRIVGELTLNKGQVQSTSYIPYDQLELH